MKNFFRVSLVIILFVIIFFGGKYIYDNKFKSQDMEDANNIIAEDSGDNEDEEMDIQEDTLEEKDDNYITLDKNSVRIPILMYHSISDADPNNNLLVSVKQFELEVEWLKENGFTPILLEDVVEAYNTGYVPKKPVAITFDDGYADNYSDAYRILKEYNMKATFFIITNNTDNDSFYMNSSMLKEMSQNGMGIENHTSRHIEFTNISREDKITVIEEGREALKEKVGVDSKFVCYPVGKYDDETIEIEKELGIEAAVTTEYGISSASDGLYSLKRVRMLPMSIDSFKEVFQEFLQ
ncbi:polysaccharide deacetylase family protein [Clostridium sp. AL.422]|uniref:polysaccharide deacetylase family protein n=1 Tax=Clostridium TaxID=1485 RepID=UPI00293DD246|nr:MULTISPECIES: polysaccharide deacetylase family protein [unclassified Clostridium]MDV4152483.1 polysaccharide deacetylase family protein [Clostridium sp. AL.422]